jgi:phage shock protein PspC (stress-responsive transcriptional regulator)
MSSPKRLVRKPSAGRIAGVCAGIADYLDTDVTLVRLLWVVLSIVPGGIIGGIIGYLAAWIIMPESNEPVLVAAGVRRLTRSLSDKKIAGVCGGLADFFKVDPTLVRVIWAVLAIVPGAIVLGVLAYLVAWFIMPEEDTPRVTATSPAA